LASDVVAVLENINAETITAPSYVRCDNGPEFTAGALIDRCNTARVDRVSSVAKASSQSSVNVGRTAELP
jgi:hypothetical protein